MLKFPSILRTLGPCHLELGRPGQAQSVRSQFSLDDQNSRARETERFVKVQVLERDISTVRGKERGLPSDQALAYALLRLTLGVTMLVHGANRIAVGVQQFAAGLTATLRTPFCPRRWSTFSR
jgi:hypothetical protein